MSGKPNTPLVILIEEKRASERERERERKFDKKRRLPRP